MRSEHPIRSYASPSSWVERAECARLGTDMSLGNPARHDLIDSPAAAARKSVCERCPVLAECRDWALSSPDPAYGHIAGGMHPLERAQARREAPTS